MAGLLLSGRSAEVAACALETALRDYRRNGRSPNEETRQLALALATAVPLVAAALPALLDAAGPQAAAAVKAEARRMTASRLARDGAGPASSVMRGTNVCSAHGGRAPQVRAAAEERIALEQAVAQFALDLTEITAGAALLRELHRTAAMVEWLSIRVNGLPEDDLIWGIDWRRITPSQAPGGQPQVVVQQRGRVHPLVVMMERTQVQLRAFADSAHRCGIEERQIRNEEMKGALIAKVVAAILNDPDLEMRPEQRAKFGQVVPRHLRAMEGP